MVAETGPRRDSGPSWKGRRSWEISRPTSLFCSSRPKPLRAALPSRQHWGNCQWTDTPSPSSCFQGATQGAAVYFP